MLGYLRTGDEEWECEGVLENGSGGPGAEGVWGWGTETVVLGGGGVRAVICWGNGAQGQGGMGYEGRGSMHSSHPRRGWTLHLPELKRGLARPCWLEKCGLGSVPGAGSRPIMSSWWPSCIC